MNTNIVDLFDYCIIARDGTPVAGKLSWDDVTDLLELLDIESKELAVSGGYDGRTQVITLPHLHDEEIQLAVTWGQVRRMANTYRMDGGPVASKPLQDQLLLGDLPKAGPDVFAAAHGLVCDMANNMGFDTDPTVA